MSKHILGIDEAGRGPVVGPMIVGGVSISCTNLKDLRHPDIQDSKNLGETTRNHMFQKLQNHPCRISLERISANQIDKTPLTRLLKKSVISLIEQAQPDLVVMDAPCTPSAIPDFLLSVKEALSISIQGLRAYPSADQHYPIVSAASIIAKVTRDERIKNLEQDFHCQIGSGYPSDPKTKSFLKNHSSPEDPLHPFIRTRWKTFQNLTNQSHQHSLFPSSSPSHD